jgi:hypothetical protein
MRRGEKRRAIPRPLIMITVVAAALVVVVGGAVSVLADVYWG